MIIAGYLEARTAVAKFFSKPSAPLEAKVSNLSLYNVFVK